MNDEAREWCRVNGIEVDDEGLPVRTFVAGPPQPCIRCGVLAEGAPGCVIVGFGGMVAGGLCGECYRLSFVDPKAFFSNPEGTA